MNVATVWGWVFGTFAQLVPQIVALVRDNDRSQHWAFSC